MQIAPTDNLVGIISTLITDTCLNVNYADSTHSDLISQPSTNAQEQQGSFCGVVKCPVGSKPIQPVTQMLCFCNSKFSCLCVREGDSVQFSRSICLQV